MIAKNTDWCNSTIKRVITEKQVNPLHITLIYQKLFEINGNINFTFKFPVLNMKDLLL